MTPPEKKSRAGLYVVLLGIVGFSLGMGLFLWVALD